MPESEKKAAFYCEGFLKQRYEEAVEHDKFQSYTYMLMSAIRHDNTLKNNPPAQQTSKVRESSTIFHHLAPGI